VNGQVTDWFKISRGCRQGDPLSPYIFVLCAEILALLIRKNDNIKGILIGNQEYLISQYADDTSITLDASENSLKHCFLFLKFYANASGLHVNIEKTKIRWFGSKINSNQILCPEINLTWEKERFTLLGIEFSTDLADMVDINYIKKIREIKNLLIQWSKRQLTPFGRIVVIKNLAMAKINHLILSLPNPTNKTVNELNNLFFKFIWNGPIDRIKRDIITKQYEEGGLKMFKIQYFINALKVSWIRRYLKTESKSTHMLKQTYPNICKFTNFGTDFVKRNIRTLDNRFWHDTFQPWFTFINQIKIKSWSDILNEPLWYNERVKVGGKSIFYRKWFEKGIIFIHDLVDNAGKLYDIDYIQNMLGQNVNVLQIQGVIKAIRKLISKYTFEKYKCNTQRPSIPISIQILLYDSKGCQRIYNVLSKNNSIPVAQRKWHKELLLSDLFSWEKAYILPHTITKDTHLKLLQYRLEHRILSTNTFLCKIKIKQDDKCTFCKLVPETLIHLFWFCPIIQKFWQSLTDWLKKECIHIRHFNLTITDIIFQIHDKKRADEVLNIIILLAKQYIYRMKYRGAEPNLQYFKKSLKFYYNTEKYLTYCNCDWTSFDKRWSIYKNLIQ